MQVSRKLIENVGELKKALNEISVYDFDVYTSMELYYKIANKLNEVIKELMRFEGLVSDEVIKQNEKLIYLLGEGLNIEVVKKINQMVADGTMDTIINHNVFNSLNNKIEEIETKLHDVYVDTFKNYVFNYGMEDEDWTSAIQLAIDTLAQNVNGGNLIFGRGTYNFGEVKISSKNICVTGSGVLNGRINIISVDTLDSDNFNIESLNTRIENLTFIKGVNAQHEVGIYINNTRDVIIDNCIFRDLKYAIMGESLREDFPWQQTARVRISDCTFYDSEYFIYTKFKRWHNGASSKWVYSQHGDWTVKGCYFYDNKSKTVNACHFEGIDGLVFVNNFIFHGTVGGKSSVKSHNLYIHQSNFTIISNNNFFEAGECSIYATEIRSLNITNNNCAWCGQRVPSSAIYCEISDFSTHKEMCVNISNNTISSTTKHGIEIGNNIINCLVQGNVLQKEGKSKHYYGDTNIETMAHKSIYVKQPGDNYDEMETVVVQNNLFTIPIQQNRGININNNYMPFVKTNRTFGNIVMNSVELVSGNVDLSTRVNKETCPVNNTHPVIIKGWTGNLKAIYNANICQEITITPNTGTLTVYHNNTEFGDTNNIQLKGKENKTITGKGSITLKKTDNYWVEV